MFTVQITVTWFSQNLIHIQENLATEMSLTEFILNCMKLNWGSS